MTWLEKSTGKMNYFTIKQWFFFSFCAFTGCLCSEEQTNKTAIFTVKRLDCEYSDVYVEAVKCELMPTENGVTRAHISADLKVKSNDLWLKTRSFAKHNNSLGYIEFIDDLCRMLIHKNGLMVSFLPIFFEIDDSLVHPCPYEPGHYEMNEYFEDRHEKNLKVADFFTPNEYDIVFRLYDGEDETIFQINVDVVVTEY